MPFNYILSLWGALLMLVNCMLACWFSLLMPVNGSDFSGNALQLPDCAGKTLLMPAKCSFISGLRQQLSLDVRCFNFLIRKHY